MRNKAQGAIERLIEPGEIASSNENIKRIWDVVGVHERPRRRIHKEKKWWRKGGPIEWVLVLEGRTVDTLEWTKLVVDEDPWAEKEARKGFEQEKKELLSVEEAEQKMEEVLKELFTGKMKGENAGNEEKVGGADKRFVDDASTF